MEGWRVRILIKGAGDLATGVAVRLHRAGFSVVMTDLTSPTAVRRTVSFCEAIPEGVQTVEGIRARRAAGAEEALRITADGDIAVIPDPEAYCLPALKPAALVDAILAKRNTGTTIDDAPVVIALGPGFTAGYDCHAVVETMRGHDLGRVILNGSARPNTGVPGEIGGFTVERLLRAPADGPFHPLVTIGDVVTAGDRVAEVSGQPVLAQISGVVRGLLREGTPVHNGMKSGDIDPRCEARHCFSVSDKARAIGGGVLEAILTLGGYFNGT
jgi:xanthine dehydrogenase accessory factor